MCRGVASWYPELAQLVTLGHNQASIPGFRAGGLHDRCDSGWGGGMDQVCASSYLMQFYTIVSMPAIAWKGAKA